MTGFKGDRRRAKPKQPLMIFSPYPPAKSGIADYVVELMPYHAAEFDVTLVVADDAPVPAEPELRILLASEFQRHRLAFDRVPKIYHIGNNPQHCYMLDIIGLDPGIVVLHDFNLCYLYEMGTLRWGKYKRFDAAMEKEYGTLGGDVVRWQHENMFRELFTGYELPLNGHVLESATAVITHSRQVQYKVAARVPRTPVWYVPHHVSPSVAAHSHLTKMAARKRIGLSASEIIVTALGFVTRAKQIPLTLAALASLRASVPPFRFILAGERRPEEYDVDADIMQSGLKNLTICTDYLDESRFFEHLAATDVVVNLRYPSGGEMSGTLLRALGMGAPTVVLDYGPIGELPGHAVRKITWGSDVQTSLTNALRELMKNAPSRLALGASAAAYVRQAHNIKAVAERYSRIVHETLRNTHCPVRTPLRQYHSSPKFAVRKLRSLSDKVAAVLPKVDGWLWWQAASVPLGAPEQAALVVSAQPNETAALLSLIFEWAPESITCVSVDKFLSPRIRRANDTAIPAGAFSFALGIVPADLEEIDAAVLLQRLNAALRIGASVALETWAPDYAGARRDAALRETDLGLRLADAGFASIRSILPQSGFFVELALPSLNDETERRHTCLTARKISDYAVWRYLMQQDGLPARWGGRTGMADAKSPTVRSG